MNSNNIKKIIKLRALRYEYWYMCVDNCKDQNMPMVLDHLENINKIEKQIQNLQNNYSIDYKFSYD